MNDDIRAALARIEAKLDALLSALANEEEPEEGRTLDGEPAGRQREEQPL